MIRKTTLVLAALAGLALASPAMARDVASCDNPRILKEISWRFDHQVRNVPHLPDVSIEHFDRVHQHRFVEASAYNATVIPRRYCMATAIMDDGRRRWVWYMIEGGMGFAGHFGDGVQFCVSGFDRWNVYNASCRILR